MAAWHKGYCDATPARRFASAFRSFAIVVPIVIAIEAAGAQSLPQKRGLVFACDHKEVGVVRRGHSDAVSRARGEQFFHIAA